MVCLEELSARSLLERLDVLPVTGPDERSVLCRAELPGACREVRLASWRVELSGFCRVDRSGAGVICRFLEDCPFEEAEEEPDRLFSMADLVEDWEERPDCPFEGPAWVERPLDPLEELDLPAD